LTFSEFVFVFIKWSCGASKKDDPNEKGHEPAYHMVKKQMKMDSEYAIMKDIKMKRNNAK